MACAVRGATLGGKGAPQRAAASSVEPEGGAMTVSPAPIHHPTPHRWIPTAVALVVVAAVAATLGYALRGNGTSTTSSVTGSGTAVAQHRVVPAFTSVDLTGANNVVIRV